ncbi:ATP-dependent DNA helicase [Robertkochia aurantiaca]|uniref:ATP-dependent DNA helicase n=1 Tax=Robertkochia aurantiaca TaxID=2873700 RepID=UPI001CCAA5A1|nr:AAA family ATPase [Robertkochia sp. 3YJGBD-33]
MDAASFYKLLKENFPHNPTVEQDLVLQQLADFVFSLEKDEVFLLKGYAGTGKTTIIGVLVTYLWKTMKKSVLLAPTGRAAKVITNYSGRAAYTIHKHIYFPKKQKGSGVKFVLAPNKHKNTLFIVDEASMIPDVASDSKMFDNGSLLDDLITYVYSGHNCKLLLIGDTAQLPPVGLDVSPALEADTLGLRYAKEVLQIELEEVMRQQLNSGILYNATNIREQIQSDFFEEFKFRTDEFDDIVRLRDGYEIQDAIQSAFDNAGLEETAIIVRSNKRANLYNQQIRARILFQENEISPGDYLMVVRNNYFWLKSSSEAGFVANGDIIEILELFAIKELYGFRFAEVKVRMVDYPRMKPFETVLLLDTIAAETPALTYEQNNQLYQEVMKDYQEETSNYRKFMQIKKNKYFNALQVKFSYAITCHKSQGGQWQNVFIEQPYLPNGIDKDYMRWLYTAVTRAREKVYLIGFKDDSFEE